MALTKHDLNQIDKLIDRKLDMKLKNAFDDFFTNKLLPVLSQFVTKQEFNERLTPLEQDIKGMKADVTFLKDQYIGTKTDLDMEITRAKSTDHYLLQEINEVRGRMNLPPLDFFTAVNM